MLGYSHRAYVFDWVAAVILTLKITKFIIMQLICTCWHRLCSNFRLKHYEKQINTNAVRKYYTMSEGKKTVQNAHLPFHNQFES